MKRLVFALAVVAVSGCGGRYSVTGRVLYEDDTPVEAGTVIAEAVIDGKPVGLQGNISPDGRFSLGSSRPGDGAVPGTYRVMVVPPALGDSEMAAGKRPTVAGKYGKYETSGLKLEVKAQSNELTLRVTRPMEK
jgi:hypothetical protein